MRREAIRQLQTQAAMIRSKTTAALAFNDSAAADETLASLQAVPEVAAAAIVDATGEPFADYRRSQGAPNVAFGSPGQRFEDGWFVLVDEIRQDDRQVGTLQMVYDM